MGHSPFDAKDKENIRQELDLFNVNEATLFPELEHQMRYIKSQAKTPVGAVEDYKSYIRKDAVRINYNADITLSDIKILLKRYMPDITDQSLNALTNEITKYTMIVDWQNKDSIISGMRRLITRKLVDSYSADDARSKADEILNNLLGLSGQRGPNYAIHRK